MKGTGGGAWRQPELDTTGLAVHTQTGGEEARSWQPSSLMVWACEHETCVAVLERRCER